MDNNFGRRDSNTDEGRVSLAIVDCDMFVGTIGPAGGV
jgi:hypothetical protein